MCVCVCEFLIRVCQAIYLYVYRDITRWDWNGWSRVAPVTEAALTRCDDASSAPANSRGFPRIVELQIIPNRCFTVMEQSDKANA